MDEFVKSIKLSFDYDKKSVSDVRSIIENLKKESKFEALKLDDASIKSMKDLVEAIDKTSDVSEYLSDFTDALDKGIIDKDTAIAFQLQIDQLNALDDQISTTAKLIDELSKFSSDDAKENVKQLTALLDKLKEERKKFTGEDEDTDEDKFEGFGGDGFFASSAKGKKGIKYWGLQQLKKLFDSFIEGIKNTFDNALDEMDSILSYSQLTDSQIREQAFSYGFNPAQNYAYSKTAELLGISSFEDLAFMNNQQRQKFYEKFNEYNEQYTSLFDSGYFEEMQEFKWEMAEFKEDMTYDFMHWMMDNRDTLMNFMSVIASAAETTVEALGWIVDYFGNRSERSTSSRSATTADIIRNNSVSNKNTNVKIDNTFNNVDSSDKAWVARSEQMTFEQIMRALTDEED